MSKDILNDKIKQMQLTVAMAEAFPEIVNAIGISEEEIADLTGVNADKIRRIGAREYIPAWNEYMALIFLFVTNDKSRGLAEERGLFPEELKNAMTINRNTHG
jgi:hypothetical protein